MNYLLSSNAIHFTSSQGVPYVVARTDKVFPQVVEALRNSEDESVVIDIIESERKLVESAAKATSGITVEGGNVYHNGERVASVLEARILEMIKEGFSLVPMDNFLSNLKANPSYRVREQLYAFLEKGGCAITEDGCFLAYKAIRGDWKDIHSGKFDNSIGAVVSMPRTQVDDDPTRTCSAGLHVCSFDYLPHFSHANGHVVCCKVNPRDVVSIPVDYNNTKMRVCEYTVVSEYKGYYEGKGDVLRSASVAIPGQDDAVDAPFAVEVLWSDAVDGSDYSVESTHVRMSEAFNEFAEYDEDNTDIVEVRVINRHTGAVLETKTCSGELEVYSDDFGGTGSSDGYTSTEDLNGFIVVDAATGVEIPESEDEGVMEQEEAMQLALEVISDAREQGQARTLRVVSRRDGNTILTLS